MTATLPTVDDVRTLPGAARPTRPRTFPSERSRAAALVAGGVVSAAGHLLHPLDHSAASREVARFELAHVLFIVGSMLLLAGLPHLRRLLRADRTAAIIVGALAAGTMLLPALVSVEAFVSPHVDQVTFDAIVESGPVAAAGGLAAAGFVVGLVGIGVLTWRRRVAPRPLAALLAACGVLTLLIPGLPGNEGMWTIGIMTALSLGLAGFPLAAGKR